MVSSNVTLSHPSGFFPSISPPKICALLSCPHCTSHHPSLSSLIWLIIILEFCEEYKPRSSSTRIFLHTPATYSLDPNFFLSTTLLKTHTLCSFLNMSDHVSHPHIKSCVFIVFHLFHGATVPSGSGPPHYEASRTHSDISHSVGLLWTSDQPNAETSVRQHTITTRNKHPCPRPDSIQQSQQELGRKTTP